MNQRWDAAPAADAFVGRRAELAALEAVRRESVDTAPRLAVVTGPPGIGKSALLRAFLARCGGLSVLRASGDEAEKTLRYGVVGQLVGAASVLGQGDGGDPLTVGSRLLGVLTSAVAPGGLVMVVDDVHCADAVSLQALTFALRRLRGDRVMTVLSCRDDALAHLPASLGRLLTDDGRQVSLGPLDDEALAALGVALGHARLSASAAGRLGRHTGGNPLHAKALIEELGAAQLERPGASLPAPRSFATLVTARLARCAPATRELVTAMAVLGLRCRLSHAAEVAEVNDPLGCLDEAVNAQLVIVSPPGDQLRFAHGLIRAAVYFDLSAARRSGLHARAADVLDTEDAVLAHRVAASGGGDTELAADAADVGRRRAAAGAWAAAAEAFAAAGRLARHTRDQQRWTLQAVECLTMLGDVAEAAAYVPQVEGFQPSARRDFVLGHVALLTGAPVEATTRLAAAWDACGGSTDDVLAARIAIDVAHLAVNQGRGEATVIWARRALAVPGHATAAADATTSLCLGLGVLGRAGEGLATVAAPETVGDLDAHQLDTLVGRGVLNLWVDEQATAQADLARAETGLRRHGPLHLRVIALFYLADTEYRMGSWSEAVAHSQLAVSLARDADQLWQLALVHAIAAFPMAAQGHWATAQAHVTAAVDAAGQLGDVASVLWSSMAAARLAHARGDADAVLRALAPVPQMIDVDGRDEPGIQPWQPLWAEALIATGRHTEAERIMADLADRLEARPHPTAVIRLARLNGLLALRQKRLADADVALVAGANYPLGQRSPLERALLLTDHGAVLRRLGRRRAAVATLSAASDILAALGAAPFLERCQREQAACGQTPKPHRDPNRELTPHERAVATLVVSGMTNREVAEELIVSVKTVEYHLRNIFTKLDVNSRGRLAAKLLA